MAAIDSEVNMHAMNRIRLAGLLGAFLSVLYWMPAAPIGLDIAKSVFQVHGVDATGQVVLRRQLRRRHVLAFFQKLPPWR
jgi:hypothetical protein